MSVDFRMLGPLDVVDDGRSIDIGSPKQRALLALLLINANRVLTTDRILEELWGAEAADKENALWVYVSRLRSAFEPARTERGESTVLLTRDHGYVLQVDPQSIDAWRFEADVKSARPLIPDDPIEASEKLGTALELWRGSALQDFVYDDFAQVEITRLDSLRLTALEYRIEADLRRGLAGELVSELEALRLQYPTQERFVSQLMLALYQSGRQADALRAYGEFRRHLGEELGVEPTPELRRFEEQVLLHDEGIGSRISPALRVAHTAGGQSNPFKGLRTFYEDDSQDFFGRDRLVAAVVRRIEQGAGLITLVGPSGSGKSSLVRAGLIPALRKGAISGSDGWPIAQMVPGARPFAELEVGLLRSSLDAPDSLADMLARPGDGVLRAALRLLPKENSRLLLVIDQFEELFTLVEDESERTRFMSSLLPLIDDPHHRITVAITLRADFYDKPLAYPEFADRMGEGVVNVVPLSADELEDAARRPASRAGVALEPALLVSLLTDVVGQPGALPLFQYTLTELFDRRDSETLTLESYRSIDGVQGALTRRADGLYTSLTSDQQIAARQLFLRLVSISDNDEWVRRRVPASEIVSLDVDLVAVQGVVQLFTDHRLLTVDRDLVTGGPTVEVAHEALLTEWVRLRGWIDEGREDVKRHMALGAAMNEWIDSDRHPDFLLTGSRLEGYERWTTTATMRLTVDEKEYVAASVEAYEQTRRLEEVRSIQEGKTQRAARRRLWGLVAAALAAVAFAVIFLVVALESEPVRVGVVAPSAVVFGTADLLETGAADAQRELGVEVEILTGSFTGLEGQYRSLAETGTDLVFIDPDNSGWPYVGEVIADHPDTAFAVLDGIIPAHGAQSVYFAEQEGGYLAGIAAAMSTETRIVGFVGGHQTDTLERWRAGYEAGVHFLNPNIEVVAIYISTDLFGFEDLSGGKEAAEYLYGLGADVVMAVAGDANLGVIEAAWEQSNETDTHLWVIGSDSDWSLGIADHLQRHVLTSALRKFDVAIFQTIKGYTDGDFAPGIKHLTVAVGALGLAPSNNLSDEAMARVDVLTTDVASNTTTIPIAPAGDLLPPPGHEVSQLAVVTWNGETCTYAGPTDNLAEPMVMRLELVNLDTNYRSFRAGHDNRFGSGFGVEMSTLVGPGGTNTAYITLHSGIVELICDSDPRDPDRTDADEGIAVVLGVE